MIRLVLRALNAPLLLLLCILGIALQTSLFSFYPLLYLQPDIVLLVVIWCALRRSFFEGGILTLLLADFAELHSAAPQGCFLLAYILIFLGVRAFAQYMVISDLAGLVSLSMGASIAWKLICYEILNLLGAAENQWRHTAALLLPGAVMVGVIAIWIFRWLEKFDWVTYKNARAMQILEDELQLDGEGL